MIFHNKGNTYRIIPTNNERVRLDIYKNKQLNQEQAREQDSDVGEIITVSKLVDMMNYLKTAQGL